MRLLHVVATGLRRGAEVFASDLSGELEKMGAEQCTAVLRHDGTTAMSYAGDLELLPASGRPFPIARFNARSAISLGRLVDRYQPDIVQTHGGEALKYVLGARPMRRPPIIYRRIGMAAGWLEGAVMRGVHGALIRRADHTIVLSESVRRETIALFKLRADKVTTIPNGVSYERLRARRPVAETRRLLGIPSDARVVLSLGALSPEKDPLAALEIGAATMERAANVWHLLVGDGPSRPAVEEEIARRGLERVVVAGVRDDVGDILAASDVLLITSLTEGVPAAAIEAGLFGVPVVTLALPGVSDVVIDGVTGYVCPPGTPAIAVGHMDEILRDEALRKAVGNAARARCATEFDISAVARRYQDVYEAVAQRPAGAIGGEATYGVHRTSFTP